MTPEVSSRASRPVAKKRIGGRGYADLRRRPCRLRMTWPPSARSTSHRSTQRRALQTYPRGMRQRWAQRAHFQSFRNKSSAASPDAAVSARPRSCKRDTKNATTNRIATTTSKSIQNATPWRRPCLASQAGHTMLGDSFWWRRSGKRIAVAVSMSEGSTRSSRMSDSAASDGSTLQDIPEPSRVERATSASTARTNVATGTADGPCSDLSCASSGRAEARRLAAPRLTIPRH